MEDMPGLAETALNNALRFIQDHGRPAAGAAHVYFTIRGVHFIMFTPDAPPIQAKISGKTSLPRIEKCQACLRLKNIYRQAAFR
jgi:hypothetical protein